MAVIILITGCRQKLLQATCLKGEDKRLQLGMRALTIVRQRTKLIAYDNMMPMHGRHLQFQSRCRPLESAREVVPTSDFPFPCIWA